MSQPNGNGVYSWDSGPVDVAPEQESGGGSYTLLPAGEYSFRVKEFSRGRYEPSSAAKTPPCPQASIVIEVDGGPLGTTALKDFFPLHSNFTWKHAKFFKSIGMRKSGEPIDFGWWRRVLSARGRVKLKQREGTGKYEGKSFNEVDDYLEPATVQQQTAMAGAAMAGAAYGSWDDKPTAQDDIPF